MPTILPSGAASLGRTDPGRAAAIPSHLNDEARVRRDPLLRDFDRSCVFVGAAPILKVRVALRRRAVPPCGSKPAPCFVRHPTQLKAMPLHSSIDPASSDFARNADAMRTLVADLNDKLGQVAGGGGETARKRHLARGKLLARQRVDLLLAPGPAFLELSPLAAHGLYGGDVHSASIVTGVGRISGRECVIVANDATIKGGTYYPLTVKKHLRAQDVARQNKLPCVYMVDSGGAFLPMQDEIFPDERHFGRIFY